MSKEMLSDPTNYKPQGHAETPYMRAMQEWDSRIGATVVQAKNWRLAFFSAAGLSFMLAAGMFYQSLKHQVVPVIVTLDKDKGEPQVIGRAGETDYKPQLAEIKYFIGRVIVAVRGVPSDPVLIRRNWSDAYAFMRQGAANQLNEMTRRDKDSPLARIGQEVVNVQLVSVVQVTGSQSYQARWVETVYSKDGGFKERYNMTGIFAVEMEPPRDEKRMMVNPLGLYIKSFQWSRDL